MSNFGNFILNFGLNFLVALLVVRFIYYPSTHNKRYVFTFLAFNTVIYFVLSWLKARSGLALVLVCSPSFTFCVIAPIQSRSAK